MNKSDTVGLIALTSIISTQIFYFTSELNWAFSMILMFIGICCPGILVVMYQKDIRKLKESRNKVMENDN